MGGRIMKSVTRLEYMPDFLKGFIQEIDIEETHLENYLIRHCKIGKVRTRLPYADRSPGILNKISMFFKGNRNQHIRGETTR